jgi:trigger factor
VNITKEIEQLENSQVKVKIKVSADDVKKEYDSIVDEYCRKAHIPGFRPGKVPADVLIRKFGPTILDEARVEVMEKSITEALENAEQKPLPYDSPDIQSEDKLELGKEFAFAVVYDTYPKVELAPYTGIEIEEPAWEIADEDLGRELKAIQEQNALFTDKEMGKVETGNIVNIDYFESEPGGAEKHGTKREAFVFEVGTGYNVYKIDDELLGMKKGEVKTVTKAYPEDFETKALAGKAVTLKVTLNTIKEKKLPEINDDLAQDISEKFATLDDLKADIRKKLEEGVKSAIRSNSLNTLLDKVTESSTIPMPKSLVEYQLGMMWRDYLNRLRIDEKTLLSLLEKQGKTIEDIRKDWLPGAEKRARLQLVLTEIGKREQIAIEEEELDQEIARVAATQQVEPDALKESLAQKDLIEYMKGNLKVDKLYDFLLSKAAVRKGKKMKVMDILQGN